LSDIKHPSRRSEASRIAGLLGSCRFLGKCMENVRKRRGFSSALPAGFLVGAAVSFGGCGSSQPAEPVSVSAGFDVSVTSASPGIRQGYTTAAAALADALVAHGGTLRVKAFRGSAVEVATLEGDPGVSPARRERDLEDTGALSGLAAVVQQALGQEEASPELAARLSTLTPGSSVAATLRLAVEDVIADPGIRVAAIVSDGRDNVLPDGVRDDDAGAGPRSLAETLIAELGDLDASGVTVVVAGVGQGLAAAPAARLVEAWRIACEATGAARCIVDADTSIIGGAIA
jgi:hypothetical protein